MILKNTDIQFKHFIREIPALRTAVGEAALQR